MSEDRLRLGEQPNALAFEYQRDCGTALGDLQVSDLVNNPTANGVCRVLHLSFSEEITHLVLADRRPLGDDRADPLLVREDAL